MHHSMLLAGTQTKRGGVHGRAARGILGSCGSVLAVGNGRGPGRERDTQVEIVAEVDPVRHPCHRKSASFELAPS